MKFQELVIYSNLGRMPSDRMALMDIGPITRSFVLTFSGYIKEADIPEHLQSEIRHSIGTNIKTKPNLCMVHGVLCMVYCAL